VILQWDPRKAASDLRKHRVDFHEAGTVLDDPLSTTFPTQITPLRDYRGIRLWAYPCGSTRGPRRSDPLDQREASDPARANVYEEER